MLSVKKLSSASEAGKYYDKADYYTKGESGVDISSEWHGQGAESLGLHGPVERGDFESILAGNLPNGQSLARPSGDRVPGWDFTFSAPKSVSLMALIGNDERLLAAHFDSVKATLDFAEKEFLVSRITQQEQTKLISTKRLVAALFTHTTSRALDPQLHTHSVITNTTEDDAQKWRSIESKPLFTNKMLLGQIYRSELANMVQKLGYNIDWDRHKGTFEIEGIDQSTLDHFSKRRKQIKAYADEKGLGGGKEMAEAALKTRSSKKDVATEHVIEQWDNEANDIGFDHQTLRIRATENTRIIEPTTLFNAEKIVRFAYRNLSFNEAVFSRQQLIDEAFKFGHGRCSLKETEQAIDSLVHKKELSVAQLNTLTSKNQVAYTTREAIDLEQHNLQLMTFGMGELGPIARKADIKEGIERHNEAKPDKQLQQEQIDTIYKALRLKDRVIAIQGYAGVGKSTALNSIREIAEHRGYAVKGYAPTGKAAQQLQQAANIKSNTIESLLEMLSKAPELPDLTGDLWVIDETSMSNSRQLNNLLGFSRKTNARLLLVGDKDQLSAVEQGKPFEQAQKEGVALQTMSNVQRQKNPDLKNAVLHAINGDISASLSSLGRSSSSDTGLVSVKSSKERTQRIIEHYVSLVQEGVNRSGSTDHALTHYVKLLIPDNETRRSANELIRKKLQAANLIGPDKLETSLLINSQMKPEEKADRLMYQAGQVVRFLKDRSDIGVKANEYYRVTKLSQDKKRLILSNGKRTIEWDPDTQGGREQFSVVVYSSLDISLAEGDFIRWRDKHDEAGLKNADIAKVTDIDGTKVQIQLMDGRSIRFDVNQDRYKHFEFEYASTVHAAQGDTYKKVVTQLDSKRKNLVNQRSLYVALSRAEYDATIYTDDAVSLAKQVQKRTGEKSSALEGIGYQYGSMNRPTVEGTTAVPHFTDLEKAVKDVIKEINTNEAVFTRNRLLKAVSKHAKSTVNIDTINEIIDRLVGSKDLIPAQLPEKLGGTAAFTTGESVVKEWRYHHYAKEGINAVHPIVSKSSVASSAIVPPSHPEALFALTSTDRFSAVSVSGREEQVTMLTHIHKAAERHGFNVKTLTSSAKQADNLDRNTPLIAHTVSGFIYGQKQRQATQKMELDIWLVDQANLLSSNEVDQLMQSARRVGSRVILTGDPKEISGINQGKPFEQLLQSGIGHLDLTGGKGTIKSNHSIKNTITNASQLSERSKRLEAAVEHYSALSNEERLSHIFWVPNKKEREIANNLIRQSLIQRGDIQSDSHSIALLARTALTTQEMSEPLRYAPGMMIKLHNDDNALGLKKNHYYSVISRSVGELVIGYQGARKTLSSSELESLVSSGISTYTEQQTNVAKGERIRAKVTDRQKEIVSGEIFTVVDINEKQMTIQSGTTKHLLDLNEPAHRHFTYAYTGTHYDVISGTHKSASTTFEAYRDHQVSQKTLNSLLASTSGSVTVFVDNKTSALDAIDRRTDSKASSLQSIGIEQPVGTLTESQRSQKASHSNISIHSGLTAKRAIEMACAHLYNNESLFKRTELLKTAITFSGLPPDQLNTEIARQLQSGELIESNLSRDGAKHETVITTHDAFRREQYMIDVFKKGIGSERSIGSASQINTVSEAYGFNNEQEAALVHLLTNKDTVMALQGNDSEQLTDVLKAFTEAAQKRELKVTGLSPRTQMTEQLQEELGVDTKNIQSLLMSLNNKRRKPNLSGHLWLLKGSGMISTKEMTDLLTLSRQTGARILLTGDIKQNPSVGQGMPFQQLLNNKLKSKNLYVNAANKSQTNSLAWQSAFSGYAAKALDNLKGDIHEIPNSEERHQRVVEDYLKVPPQKRHELMIVAASNKARAEITDLLRTGLKAEGLLHNGVNVGVLENANLSKEQRGLAMFYKPNMQVRFNRDYASLGVKQGEYCKVTEVRNDHVRLETVN
ncbi:MobF family relaxase, partial [Pseudoalteromonas luteoviolacea]|uniref:MobF family relaxase n=1 Tax=Pseudoalteromonas luteoviolacea TaxID=43657 RepID=UPI001B39B4B9